MIAIASLLAKPLLPVFAAASCNNSFFGFPQWWKYLKPPPAPPDCEVIIKHFPNDLWAIGFAVIDMLLYLAGLVAIASIIIAGFMYVTSQGNSEKTTSARRRIINSLIGLVIVLSATTIVRFLGKNIG